MPEEPTTSTTWREERRLRAWELHQEGWSQRRIAEAVGVTQGAVSQWFIRVRKEGAVAGLGRHPAPGRVSVLTKAQLDQLPVLLERGAKSFGFEDDGWTSRRVAAVLKEVFEISYHPAHVSRLLKKYYPDWRSGNKTLLRAQPDP